MSKKQKSGGEKKFESPAKTNTNKFHLEFKHGTQKLAYAAFQQSDVLFLVGPAGTGKTHLATAFAINEVLRGAKQNIVMTRPIVESGEKLGHLPGDLHEKVNPYMIPLYTCMNKMIGNPAQREQIEQSVEVAPLAYMRGRTFDDSVCIFDEAQNATKSQLKLFLTRFGANSKIIITGDLSQSDIGDASGLEEVVDLLADVNGISVVEFDSSCIQRHPLVGAILDKLGN